MKQNILYLLLLAGVAAAVAAAEPPPASPQGMSLPAGTGVPAAPPPLPAGPAPDLVIAFTSQVVGYIEPCG